MKRLLFTAFVLVFAFGITAGYAWSDSCCSKKKAEGDVKASAAKKAGQCTRAKGLSDEESKGKHHCPDVSERAALNEFHEAMHPMHAALNEKDFEGLNECLPNLLKASETLIDYKCEGYEKCSDPRKKDFDGRKAELIEAVDGLKEVCKGKDQEKMTANFDVMHEAYITFANVCVHPEGTEKEHKAEKEKAE